MEAKAGNSLSFDRFEIKTWIQEEFPTASLGLSQPEIVAKTERAQMFAQTCHFMAIAEEGVQNREFARDFLQTLAQKSSAFDDPSLQ